MRSSARIVELTAKKSEAAVPTAVSVLAAAPPSSAIAAVSAKETTQLSKTIPATSCCRSIMDTLATCYSAMPLTRAWCDFTLGNLCCAINEIGGDDDDQPDDDMRPCVAILCCACGCAECCCVAAVAGGLFAAAGDAKRACCPTETVAAAPAAPPRPSTPPVR